jgi:hypothetical protein
MSRAPTMAELAGVIISLRTLPACTHCGTRFGEMGPQQAIKLMEATAQHKSVCPKWPTPRSRTAQHRPIKGQMVIPVNG